MELSVGKLLLLLVIIVLVFGTAKLPKIGEDLGRAFRGFKKAMNEGDDKASASGTDADKSKSDSSSDKH